jgi:iron complex outermembrane recepter protein
MKRGLLVALLCTIVWARAIEAKELDIPAGDLWIALETLAKQTGAEIVYQIDQVRGLRTKGVSGNLAAEEAVRRLIEGTPLVLRVDSSGAMLIALPSAQHPSGSARELGPTSDESRKKAPPQSSSRLAAGAIPPATPNEPPELQEVVVTGTLIRGIAPVGTNLITIGSDTVAATGATASGELLQMSIPQLESFNSFDAVPENTQVTVKRLNLRGLPGLTTSGGSTTLVLVDGHRVVNAGIQQTAPDPDIVPPGAIERVEVMPDGGSATYGADAVGGVVNFVTRRHFNGVQVGGHYGHADNYNTYGAHATAGHDWDGGSAYVSYSYARHDALFGRDRDYVRHYSATGGSAQDVTCSPGNVAINAGGSQTLYAVPGLMPNTANFCDTTKDSTFYPAEQFNSVFVGLSQDLRDSIKLDVRAFYSKRNAQSSGGAYISTGVITGANPFYTRTTDNAAPQPPLPQSVAFSWDPIFGDNSLRENTDLESWGVTPSASIDLPHGWQIRALLNFGRSRTSARDPIVNNTLLDQALQATDSGDAIDPYDIAATPNRGLLRSIVNYEFYGLGRQELINHRLVGDGELLSLPGGDLRLAVGFEYLHELYEAQAGDVIPGQEAALTLHGAARTDKSGFAELSVPIIGKDNSIPGGQSLVLSAAERYDHYSDFGHTANPKLALTYQPLDWLALRANWGRSFNAPSLADAGGAASSVLVLPALVLHSPLPGQYNLAQSFWPFVSVLGGHPDLKPQTATTYTFGADISPTDVEGLSISASYYHIDFRRLIGTPPAFNPGQFFTYYAPFYVLNPTQQQVTAAVQNVPGGLNAIAGLFKPGAPPVYALIDDRRSNLGNARLSGLDLSVRYAHDTRFGSMDASFSGTYALMLSQQPLPGLPWINTLASDVSKLKFAAIVGTNVHSLRAQAQWNHTSGYHSIVTPVQNYVGAFDVVNLFFSFDMSDAGLEQGLQLTLNVNNMLDRDPPTLKAGLGYANGSTVGRLVQLGINKTF